MIRNQALYNNQFQMFQSRFKEHSPSEINIQKYLEDNNKENQQSCTLPCSSISLFILLGFFFILMGIATLISNYQQNIQQIQLKQQGLLLYTEPTFVSFTSDSTVDVYLKIQALTQFDYMVGNPLKQGLYYVPNSQFCGNYKNNSNLRKNISITGDQLKPQNAAFPCGLYPGMFPQGTIKIYINNISNTMLNQSDLTVFPQEIQYATTDQTKQWVNTSDPFFQAWMSQNSALSTTKLMGKLPGNFQGYFQIQIQLTNPLPMTYGNPFIILSSDKVFGNSDIPFCIVSFCQSGFLFVFAFVLYFYNSFLNGDLRKSKLQAHQIELKSISQGVSVKMGEI